MRRPALALKTLAASVLCAAALPAIAAPGCLDTAARPPWTRALTMAYAAQQEHAAFGGQTMDADGRLIESGDSEAEDTRRSAGATPPWQRVLNYWQAVDPGLPSIVRYGGLRPADRERLKQAISAPTDNQLRAAQAAIDRVAVIDTPWSAAFISWIARQAGLGPDEFTFSEAHVDYAGAAWQAGADEAAGRATAYAMRACDITRTPPRIGDLVCQTRGRGAGLDSFDRIGEVLAQRPTGGEALPMHCDVVVSVDAAGFDTVGGNVLQSVTRRRLAFAPGTRLLDASYLSEACTPGAPGCIDRHMSRQPWSLLLQWR